MTELPMSRKVARTPPTRPDTRLTMTRARGFAFTMTTPFSEIPRVWAWAGSPPSARIAKLRIPKGVFDRLPDAPLGCLILSRLHHSQLPIGICPVPRDAVRVIAVHNEFPLGRHSQSSPPPACAPVQLSGGPTCLTRLCLSCPSHWLKAAARASRCRSSVEAQPRTRRSAPAPRATMASCRRLFISKGPRVIRRGRPCHGTCDKFKHDWRRCDTIESPLGEKRLHKCLSLRWLGCLILFSRLLSFGNRGHPQNDQE